MQYPWRILDKLAFFPLLVSVVSVASTLVFSLGYQMNQIPFQYRNFNAMHLLVFESNYCTKIIPKNRSVTKHQSVEHKNVEHCI